MQNYMNSRQRRAGSPLKQDERKATTTADFKKERLLRAQAVKMTPPSTKLSRLEANIEDNHSLGDSSVGVDTLKENVPRQSVRDTFETDDEHADLTTTTGSHGFEDQYESNGNYKMPSQQNRFASQELNYNDDEESQVDAEEAQQYFPHDFDKIRAGFTDDVLSRVNNGVQFMNYAQKNHDSFPATTDGDISEPEVDDGDFDDPGQEVGYQHQTHKQTQPQNPPLFFGNLAQRTASSILQTQSHLNPHDTFNAVRNQASAPRHSPKPDPHLAHIRATQSGSPQPMSAVAIRQEVQNNHAEASSRLTPPPTNKNKQPAIILTGPRSPDRSIADAINATSDKTLSLLDAQTLSNSSESVLPLDYNDDVLHKMSYDDLANESFDHNPRLDRSTVPLADSTAPLAERLHQMKAYSSAEQAAFFAALPIEEWEDAGAWFIQQFGDVMNRFTEARREKRRAARAYEDEVAKRYGEVARKKRRIEEEIENMKEKGRELLPKTPSKSRAGSAMR